MNLALSSLLVTTVLVFHLSDSDADSRGIVGYYPEERHALLQLRDSVNSTADLHGNWTGPPCVDNLSRWVGIACSKWHVIHVVLEGIQLTGSLPPTFLQNITMLSKLSFRNNSIFGPLPNLTNLVHLEYVSLSQNHFTGSIPVYYIGLPNLTLLEMEENFLDGNVPPFDQPSMTFFNVSYNNLEGPIPKTIVLQRFPKSSYDHNLYLCGPPLEKLCPVPPTAPSSAPSPIPVPQNPSAGKNAKDLQMWSIILIVAAAAIIPFLVMLVFLCQYRRYGREATRGEQAEGSAGSAEKKMVHSKSIDDPERTVELEFFNKNVPVFDLDDLLRASGELLGKGKVGTTYKAILESGAIVAVKRLKDMNELSKKEYVQQMQLLGKLRHENLVEIIAFYHSKEEKLVIYEFVPHGNLFELLHENRGVGRVPLSWAKRLSIIKDVAKGLIFLHQSLPSHKVPHANLKSSNVLIHQDSQNYHSKLTDFGFFPLMPSRKSSQKLAVAKSPEFTQGKKLTHKADVYCFGIILLEVTTGRIPGDSLTGNDETTDDLSDWVRNVVNYNWSTDILDVEILAATEGHDEMLKLTEIALECTDVMPEKRPKMSEVLRRIEEIEKGNKDNE